MPEAGPGETARRRAAAAAALLIVAAGFGASLAARAPEWGRLHPSLAGWHTAGSVIFAEHWRAEGPFRIAFAMLWAPASVEQPTLDTRRPYTSFGSGSIVPLYLVSLAAGRAPTPAMAWGLSLAVQLLVAWTLAGVAWILARRAGAGPWHASAPAAAAGTAYVWLPSPHFEHLAAYFADQAVMLPFALFLLVEALRQGTARPRGRALCDGAQGVLIFWGLSTEWVFAFVAFTALLVRAADGSLRPWGAGSVVRALPVVAPVALALVVFLAQLWALGAFAETGARFALRSGAQGSGGSLPRSLLRVDFSDRFWGGHLPRSIGPWGRAIVLAAALCALGAALGCAAAAARRRAAAPGLAAAAAVGTLSLLPALMYYAVFREHNNHLFHYFAGLKFAVPAALTLCGVYPAVFAGSLGWPRAAAAAGWIGAAATLACLASLGAERAWPFAMVPTPPPGAAERAGPYLRAHAGHRDVLFATAFDAQEGNPIALLHTRKPVHQAAGLAAVRGRVRDLGGDCVAWLIVAEGGDAPLPGGLDRFAAIAEAEAVDGGFVVYRAPCAAVAALAD